MNQFNLKLNVKFRELLTKGKAVCKPQQDKEGFPR